jgi:membrane protein DedA with SNARE-associated domain
MTAAATVLADVLWFWLGRQGGGRVLRLMSRWTFSHNAAISQAKAFVAPPGLWAIMAAKFLPGPVMSALAGAVGMSARRFLLFDGLAALFYGSSYVTTGFLFHNQIQQVLVWLERAGHGVVGLVLVLAVGYLTCKYVLRRRAKARKSRPTNTAGKQTDPAGDGPAVSQVSLILAPQNLAPSLTPTGLNRN